MKFACLLLPFLALPAGFQFNIQGVTAEGEPVEFNSTADKEKKTSPNTGSDTGNNAPVHLPQLPEQNVSGNQGDVRSIEFVLPFEKALEKAKQENRLVFLKPIYGGVDQLGARDYRCGSW